MPIQALSCLQYTNGYSSQQALILQCSIYLTAGGITTARITQAYNAAQAQSGNSNNSAAAYVAYTEFNTYPSAAAGYQAARAAQPVCDQAGSPGMQMLADAAVIASLANSISPIDLSGSPQQITTDFQNAVKACTDNPPAASCDAQTVGQLAPAITSAANSYCASGSASEDVCGPINDAQSHYGNDPTQLSQDLLCLLQGKTYTPGSGC